MKELFFRVVTSLKWVVQYSIPALGPAAFGCVASCLLFVRFPMGNSFLRSVLPRRLTLALLQVARSLGPQVCPMTLAGMPSVPCSTICSATSPWRSPFTSAKFRCVGVHLQLVSGARSRCVSAPRQGDIDVSSILVKENSYWVALFCRTIAVPPDLKPSHRLLLLIVGKTSSFLFR